MHDSEDVLHLFKFDSNTKVTLDDDDDDDEEELHNTAALFLIAPDTAVERSHDSFVFTISRPNESHSSISPTNHSRSRDLTKVVFPSKCVARCLTCTDLSKRRTEGSLSHA